MIDAHPAKEPGLPTIFASDTAAIRSPFALFPAAPGAHQLSVVAWNEGETPTCKDLTATQGTVSTDVSAGQQALVFVYGTSLTDLYLAVAPTAA